MSTPEQRRDWREQAEHFSQILDTAEGREREGIILTLLDEIEGVGIAASLRAMADDNELLWSVARRAIEDALIEWRDNRMSMLMRNNGFVVKEKDGTPSDIIRFGPEVGVSIALHALADHLDREQVAR